MATFEPELALFGALAAELCPEPEETVFSYVNPAARRLFGEKLPGRKVVDVLEMILGSAGEARRAFAALLAAGTLIVEGELNGKEVQFHSMVDARRRHLQAAIVDTTESRRAQEGFEYTAGALSRASEVADENTGRHSSRINHYSGLLSRLLRLDEPFVQDISLLAQLHDVGKIRLAPELLRKPALLSFGEFEEMQKHTIYGARIIGKHPRLELARRIALSHHEKWDGSGYPYGLAREAIPLGARIVAIVDVFDALVSERPHKTALSYEKTHQIMSQGDYRTDPLRHFDPDILKVFLDQYDDFVQIHRDLET